ncbi:MAG: hypothetical protein ACKPKO_51420 [Candidatus Fonsibacter sp.]
MNTADMNVPLALKSATTYVYNKLDLKAKQSTTYTKTEVYTAVLASYYTNSQTYTKLDTKQNLVTTLSTLPL